MPPSFLPLIVDLDHRIQQQQQQQQKQGQIKKSQEPTTLPEDCLYNIVDSLRSDLNALHSLIFVNKFFFNAAIRHMYEDPLATWGLTDWSMLQKTQRGQFERVIVSFLQARIRESAYAPGDYNLSSQIVDGVLQRFSFQLQTTHRLAEDIHSIQKWKIDYSKLFIKLAPNYLVDTKLIRLRDIINTESQEYTTSFRENVISMLVHYNHRYIKSLSFGISQIGNFLPFSAKLSKLQSIHLGHDRDNVDPYLEDMLSFIALHQSTFSYKKSINFEFNMGWDHGLSGVGFLPKGVDLEVFFQRWEECRARNLTRQRPMIAIIKAVKRPRKLKVSMVPNFYKIAEDLEADQLLELWDTDEGRFDAGEREAMNAFFRRCKNLKTLKFKVIHHDAFAWVDEGNQGVSGEHALMKLENLTIWSSEVCHAAIKAMNDAMEIFSSSLRNVMLWHSFSVDERDLPNVYRNIRTLSSLELQRIPSACTIGEYPLLLPNLTNLKIELRHTVCVNVGSFGNCPNLEDLWIEFGYGNHHTELRPEGDEPTILPDTDVLLDPLWKQVTNDLTLFPVWNLPRLKRLTLVDKAAARFNFASLPTMRCLQELKLDTTVYTYPEESIVDYVNRQHKIIIDPTSTPLHLGLNQHSGIFGSYTNQKWTLPSLTSIYMSGLPPLIFRLDYLRLFPKLKSLVLWNSCKSAEVYRYPSYVVVDPESGIESLRDHDPITDSTNDTPFLESQLQEFTLMGDLTMSSRNITNLVTIYAPFLEKLEMGQYHCNNSTNGYRMLKAFNNADNKNSVYESLRLLETGSLNKSNMTGEGSLPGRKLLSVACYYSLDEQVINRLGFVIIGQSEQGAYHEKRLRTYEFTGALLVRDCDYEFMKRREGYGHVVNQRDCRCSIC
ncbi:hypothetical protein BGZ76_010132 [Entomortierella beljakovae]|nr:hypothetical protein BGZ76_010132 [Entomortierella beljakovae]